MFTTIVFTVASGIISLLVFLYFHRKGQFENVEDIKYEMFRNEDETGDKQP